jgi:hypothetical protein
MVKEKMGSLIPARASVPDVAESSPNSYQAAVTYRWNTQTSLEEP